MRAYCMESEKRIWIYDSGEVELKQSIVPDNSTYEWRGDSKVTINLRKANAPSYWKTLMADAVREAKELQIWWEMRDKNIEELEEYMMEDNVKERSKLTEDL